MKVLLTGEAGKHRERLAKRLGPGWTIETLPREAAYSDAFDGGIGPEDVVVSLRLRREAGPLPAFRLLHVPGAGLDGIDLNALSPRTTVCNVFEHEIPIAEYVLAAMLEWEIRLCGLRAGFTPESWPDVYRDRVPHGEIHGKSLAVLGFGRIGRAIAARAKAFGIRVLAVDAAPVDAPDLADLATTPAQLEDVLAQADYTVICCPLSPATRGMIGARQLAAMKPSGVLINVSRAEIADEAALFQALERKRIGGAILDVWYSYPQGADDRVAPASHPFHSLDNVICTPHSSAWTTALPDRRYAFIARNLSRLAAGERLENVVHGPDR